MRIHDYDDVEEEVAASKQTSRSCPFPSSTSSSCRYLTDTIKTDATHTHKSLQDAKGGSLSIHASPSTSFLLPPLVSLCITMLIPWQVIKKPPSLLSSKNVRGRKRGRKQGGAVTYICWLAVVGEVIKDGEG